jgi:hypothetical protein
MKCKIFILKDLDFVILCITFAREYDYITARLWHAIVKKVFNKP